MPISRALAPLAITAALAATVAAGCGQTTASQDDCTAAADYLQACMPDQEIVMPDGCDAEMASALLDADCETLRASAADGKADGCNPWFWWTCTSSSTDPEPDTNTDPDPDTDTDVVDDSITPNPASSGLVCGTDVSFGDHERAYDGDVDAIAYGGGFVFAGHLDLNRSLDDSDDVAYICAYELSDRASLFEEHCFLAEQPETPFDRQNPIDAMAYEDGLLYVAIERGLYVYDVSDPNEPSYVGVYLNGGPTRGSNVGLVARDLEVHDRIVYIGGGGYILDATDLDNITKLAEFDGFIEDWTIVDGIAYAGRGDDGVATFDVSDPRQPRLLDSYLWSRPGTDPNIGEADFDDVAYADGYLYAAVREAGVADDRNGLWVFDVSDPTNIEIVHKSAGSPEVGIQVAYADGFLFHVRNVSDGYASAHHEIGVYDVSDPTSPRLVDNIDDTRGDVKDLLIADGNLVFNTEEFGSSSFRASDGIATLRAACD